MKTESESDIVKRKIKKEEIPLIILGYLLIIMMFWIMGYATVGAFKPEPETRELTVTVDYIRSTDTYTLADFTCSENEKEAYTYVYLFKGDYDLAPVCGNEQYIITVDESNNVLEIKTMEGEVVVSDIK